MRPYLFLIFAALITSCAKKSPIMYPETKKEIVILIDFDEILEGSHESVPFQMVVYRLLGQRLVYS